MSGHVYKASLLKVFHDLERCHRIHQEVSIQDILREVSPLIMEAINDRQLSMLAVFVQGPPKILLPQ